MFDRDNNGQDRVHCRLGPTDNFTLQTDPMGESLYDAQRFVFGAGPRQNSGLVQKIDYRLVTRASTISISGPQSSLDRESTAVQQITLTCTDSVGNKAFAVISVQLTDVNDNAPTFVEGGHFIFHLPENQELIGGKPIWLGRTAAVDRDLDRNAEITYELYDEDESWIRKQKEDAPDTSVTRVFEINPRTGDLYAKVMFDRETAPENGVYRLRVHAVDAGTPKLTGTATVEVFILDMNDWPPQFTKDVYTFSVSEDAQLQHVVDVVEAIDQDADSSGKITYHLLTNTDLDAQTSTGRKYRSISEAPRKRNRSNAHNKDPLRSIVRRDAMMVQSSTIANGLTEDRPEYAVKIDTSENDRQLLTSYDGQLDGYQRNPSMYTPLNYFSIDKLSGKLRVIRKLDRESIGFFSISVVAVDFAPISTAPLKRMSSIGDAIISNGVNRTARALYGHSKPISLSSTATVVIAVTDVNDNSPIFRSPNTSTPIRLPLYETLGSGFLTLHATDADEGENGRITYRISSEFPRPPNGPGVGHFAIGDTNGVLIVAK